jgi:hypothetical protein
MRTPGGSPRPNTGERAAAAVEESTLISGLAAPHGHSPQIRRRPPSLPDIQIYLSERVRNFALNQDKTLEYRQ